MSRGSGKANSRRAQWVSAVGYDPTKLAVGQAPPVPPAAVSAHPSPSRSRREAWLASLQADGGSLPSAPVKSAVEIRKEQVAAQLAATPPVVPAPSAAPPVPSRLMIASSVVRAPVSVPAPQVAVKAPIVPPSAPFVERRRVPIAPVVSVPVVSVPPASGPAAVVAVVAVVAESSAAAPVTPVALMSPPVLSVGPVVPELTTEDVGLPDDDDDLLGDDDLPDDDADLLGNEEDGDDSFDVLDATKAEIIERLRVLPRWAGKEASLMSKKKSELVQLYEARLQG